MPTTSRALLPLCLALAACGQTPGPEEPPAGQPPGDVPGGPEGWGPRETMRALEHVIDGQATADELEIYVSGLHQRAPNAGPWHEDLFMAFSPDGLTVDLSRARRIATAAAVPQAVRDPDGRIRLLFVEGDLDRGEALARQSDPWMRDHGLVGFGAIDQLVSADEGATWSREEDFHVIGQVRGMVVDPEVHALSDGSWRLYEIGTPIPELLVPDSWADGAPHQVFCATSTDLVHWTMEGSAVTGPNADPAVWCDGDRCLMVSTGLDLSESIDGGRTFTFLGDFGTPGFAPAFLELPDGRLRLFYNSKDAGGPLRSMISTDRGRSWNQEPGDRVPAFQIEAPSFLAHPNGGWWVFYHYWHEGYSGNSWSQGYEARDGTATPEAPMPTPGPTVEEGDLHAPTTCDGTPVDPEEALERLVSGTARDCDREWASHHLQDRARRGGPWATDIALGRSTDGLHFDFRDAPAVEHAGVPELVRAPGGELLLFCIGGALEEAQSSLEAGWGWEGMVGMPAYGVLQLFVSRDEGATWTRDRGLTMEGFEPGMVVDPEVIRLPDGRFRLYLIHLAIREMAQRDAWDQGKPHRVIVAESTDLRHWRLEGDALRGPFADPSVHCAADGTCLLLSFGLEHGASHDGGLTFTLEGPWLDDGFAPELVDLPGDRLRVYYNSRAQGAPLLSQVSADGGATWTREPGRRADVYVEAPSLLAQPDGTWLAAVHRFRPETTPDFAREPGEDPGANRAPQVPR